MEIQKIISALKGENELMLFDPSTGEMGIPEMLNETDRSFYDVHLEAVKALEKLTPKKPDIEGISRTVICVKCPNCQQELFRFFYSVGKHNWNEAQKSHKYCEDCGQAIDWTDDE